MVVFYKTFLSVAFGNPKTKTEKDYFVIASTAFATTTYF